MAKDPAFLFYPNDWIGGTMGLTFEEKGAYMELLMMQFNRGHMTKHMIDHTLGQKAGQIWVNIEDKFEKDADGLYFNARLEEEKEKRKNYVKSRNNNRSGKNQYSKNKKKINGNNGGHMTSHMENENENENILDINRLNNKYKKDEKLIKAVLKNKDVPANSKNDLLGYLEEFNLHLTQTSDTHKTYPDYCKHFLNWLRIKNKEAKRKKKLPTDVRAL